jgi:hypothetical protein
MKIETSHENRQATEIVTPATRTTMPLTRTATTPTTGTAMPAIGPALPATRIAWPATRTASMLQEKLHQLHKQLQLSKVQGQLPSHKKNNAALLEKLCQLQEQQFKQQNCYTFTRTAY